jgi:mRNA degradation ribonuclease J1/J2
MTKMPYDPNNHQNKNPIDLDNIKNSIGETISKYLYQKTAKRPLVIPVVLTV